MMETAKAESYARNGRAFRGRPFSWWTLGLRTMTPYHRLHVWYVCFWLIVPSFSHSRMQWALLLLAFLIFLPFYTAMHEGETRAMRLVGLLGLSVLAFVYVPYNISAFGLYIYIATGLDYFSPRIDTFYRLLGALCLLIVGQFFVFHLPLWELGCAIASSALAGITTMMQCRQRRADARLSMAQDEIEQLAKTAERERIARDLHDVLGHTLSLITVKSELAARLLPIEPERAAQELAEIEATARRALSEVRQTVSGYRAQGMEHEVQEAAAMLRAAGIPLTERPATFPRLPAQAEAALALILREAVTNIVRHAGARTCSISLRVEGDATVLEVRDDGCGLAGREGNGMRGMRERVADLGGQLQVHSGGGTSLRVALPGTRGSVLSDSAAKAIVLSPVI